MLVAAAPDDCETEPGRKSKPSLLKALVELDVEVDDVPALVAALAGWCAFASTAAATNAAAAATASPALASEALLFASCSRRAVVTRPLERSRMNVLLCGDQRSL